MSVILAVEVTELIAKSTIIGNVIQFMHDESQYIEGLHRGKRFRHLQFA